MGIVRQKAAVFCCSRIRLTADKLVITVQGTSQEFDKSDVVRFTYKGINTGISTAIPSSATRVAALPSVFQFKVWNFQN